MTCRWAILLALGSLLTTGPAICFGEIDPPELMPENATLYVEVAQPQTVLSAVLDSPLLELLDRSDKVQKVYQSKEFRQLKTTVTLIETRLGRSWPQLARELAGSVHLAYHVPTQTSLLILKPQRAETLTVLHQAIVDLIELDATRKGHDSPIVSAEYKGVRTWSFGPQDQHAIVEGLLILSNQSAALHAAIDRTADPTLASLADAPFYLQARDTAGQQAVSWVAAGLDELRKVPKVSQALEAKSDNAGGELVAGGVVDALGSAPMVVGALHIEDGVWRLRGQLQLTGDVPAARDWFFAGPAANRPSPLDLPQMLFSLSTYRDVAGMWQARDELFDDETVAKLAQADTNLALYFAGQDFGTQILSEFGPHWQLAIARQQFEPGRPVPAIKLPALAVVMELKNPQRFGTTLLVSFQKTIGLINLVGGQQGQQQLLLSSEDYQGTTISKATYLFDDQIEMQAAPMYYNASPACARSGNYFIIGTTTEIVRQTIDSLKRSPPSDAAAVNTQVNFQLGEIAAALAENRSLLVSQNVLKEGHSAEQAEQEIDLALDLLRLASQASLTLDRQQGRLVLEATLGAAQ